MSSPTTIGDPEIKRNKKSCLFFCLDPRVKPEDDDKIVFLRLPRLKSVSKLSQEKPGVKETTMTTRLAITIFAGLCLAMLVGCNSGNNNPIIPANDETLNPVLCSSSYEGLTQVSRYHLERDRQDDPDAEMMGVNGVEVQNDRIENQAQLWGYFDIYLDIEKQTITSMPNRTVMDAYNVVDFLNINPDFLGFDINEIVATNLSFVDVDIDISLTHPLSGQTEYNGYDVRGIFMGNGNLQLTYNPDITFGQTDMDQTMLDDPKNSDGGGPDGYTRWFNAEEFLVPGVLGYTHGQAATPGYTPGTTLNPYKLFADGLDSHENAFEFVENELGFGNNVFSASSTNTRNYYLRFPLPDPDITYGYAVMASWVNETTHPANTPEVVAINISTTASDINFNEPTTYCGNFVLNVSLAGFGKQPSTIYIDADELFSTPQSINPVLTVIGGESTYSTYHIDIPVDNITSSGEKEFWVIAEYTNENYSNKYGVLNEADGPLATYFKGSVVVGTNSCNQDPICDVQVITSMPIDGWDVGIPVEFDASSSSDPDEDPLFFEWDFNDDGIYGDSYDSGSDSTPIKIFTFTNQTQVCVKVTDGQDGEAICCVDVDISVYQSKNISLRSGVEARDITVVGTTGDLLILYADGQVWKYPEPYTFDSTFSGTMFYDTGLGYLWYIEASNNEDSLVNSGTSGPPFASRSYSCTGSFINDHTWSFSSNTWNSDGWCPTGGLWDECHCTWFGATIPPYTWAWGWQPPDYNLNADGLGSWEALGPDYIQHDYLVGTEVDSDGYVYCLENGPNTDRSVERRTYRLGSQNGPYWGAFGDTSPNFNDPQDITRDNNSSNTIYVLDELSTGDPAIKKFTWDGTPDGTFGDTSSISSTPLRIEGSQRIFPDTSENLMFVLHGNVTDGYFISIFTPSELI